MSAVIDYRTDGPEAARHIALGHRACETAPNGTGSQCSCSFDCANYWLRANGFKGQPAAVAAAPVPVKTRRRWWGGRS